MQKALEGPRGKVEW